MSHGHKDRNPKRVSKAEANLTHHTQYSLGQPGLIKPAKTGLRSVLEIPVMTNRPQVTGYRIPKTVLVTLEILNRAFVFLCRSLAVKRVEIFSLARSRIFLAGIQPILAGFQFPNHGYCSARCT